MMKAIKNWWKRWKADAKREWAHVPTPDWAAKRGGRDYW